MNRIKEVLEEKGIKQTWLADNLERVTTWSTAMCKTDNNQDLKSFLK
jgi:hypothetical protein